MKKTFLIILITVIVFASVAGLALAQEQKYTGKGLVPCGGVDQEPCYFTGDAGKPTGFDQLMTMVNIVIDFLIFWLALPIAAIAFAYAGFLFLFFGSQEAKRSEAKKIAWNVLIGLVLALTAWLIVKTILVGLGLCEGYALLKGFVGRPCP